MEHCILGVYMTMENALSLLERGGNGYAIDRHVAVKLLDGRRIGLYYRDRLVTIRHGYNWNWLEGNDMHVVRRLVEKTGCLQQ